MLETGMRIMESRHLMVPSSHAKIVNEVLNYYVSQIACIFMTFPSRLILYASSTMVTILLHLPHENDSEDGSWVPTVVFKDQPTAYNAFLISIIIAFTGAFCAMLVEHRPRVESFCRVSALLSLLSALSLFCFAVASSDFWGV